MVPQENPRKVRVISSDMPFVIYQMLPGQRNGAKRLFSCFTQYLGNHHQLQTCVECPALLRGPRGVMLLHLDDVLMVCGDEWLTKTFLRDRKTNFAGGKNQVKASIFSSGSMSSWVKAFPLSIHIGMLKP